MSIPDSKESALTEECRATNLHAAIMNVPAKLPNVVMTDRQRLMYLTGHRDARHAAAELALRSDAINAELLEALIALRRAELEDMDGDLDIFKLREQADAAIAKAQA